MSLYLRAGEFDAAKQIYGFQAKTEKTTSITGKLGLAAAHFGMKEYNEALAIYQAILKENAYCPAEVRVAIGCCFYEMGNTLRARKAYLRALAVDPDCYLAIIAMVLLEYKREGPDSSFRWILTACCQSEIESEALWWLATYLVDKNEFQKAENVAKQACEQMTPKLQKDNNLGADFYAQGEYSHAVRFFKKAAELAAAYPKDSHLLDTVMFNIGRSQERLGEFIEAEKAYRSILDQNPDYIDAHIRLGAISNNLGYTSQAEKHFLRAQELDDLNPTTLLMFADFYMEQKSYQMAQRLYRSLLMINPRDTFALTSMGNMYFRMVMNVMDNKQITNFMKRSAAFYRKALESCPGNPYAASGTACLLAMDGNLEGAKLVFERVRECTLKPLDLWTNLAEVYAEQGLHARARGFLEVAMKTHNLCKDADVMLMLSNTYIQCNQLEKARYWLEKAAEEVPKRVDVIFNLAVVLKKIGLKNYRDLSSTPEAMEEACKDVELSERHQKFLKENLDKLEIIDDIMWMHLIDHELGNCKDFLQQMRSKKNKK
ncbi:hypothetical protein L596_007510 [Steinernema carpocapsae]|uniref:Uncharacterized protein n=1 Tax=Steinernema carpocapsae TaxID=34508 RepID=A0A4U5PAJ3_STECR|nr:hypothetical protein L596_007510 [Steinernema carpocapsae]